MNKNFLVTIILIIIIGITIFLVFSYKKSKDFSKNFFNKNIVQVPITKDILVQQLRDTGVTAKWIDEKSSPFFFSIGATLFIINGAELLLFEFDDPVLAGTEASQVAPDGSSRGEQKFDWDITPHFFKKDRFIVLYKGENQEVLRALEVVFGPEFAGGYKPIIQKEPPFISWEEVVNLLRTAKVIRVHQTHSGNIYIDLKDGIVLKTKEPTLDAIFEEIKKCGEVCKNIDVGQE